MLKQGQSFRPEPPPKDQAGHFYYVSQLWQNQIYSHGKQTYCFSIPTPFIQQNALHLHKTFS